MPGKPSKHMPLYLCIVTASLQAPLPYVFQDCLCYLLRYFLWGSRCSPYTTEARASRSLPTQALTPINLLQVCVCRGVRRSSWLWQVHKAVFPKFWDAAECRHEQVHGEATGAELCLVCGLRDGGGGGGGMRA